MRARDLAAVETALAAGANPRAFFEGETPLHVAARCGTLAIVEALIEGGALEWIVDSSGRTALDAARSGDAEERTEIVSVLDRTAIADPAFRAAVAAIHHGDVAGLERLLDAEPRLLTERNIGPDVYRRRARRDYFLDPKLVWYVANNPTTVERMAPNIVEVANAMIERGVERDDLDYTLELVMTSAAAREQDLQIPLMRALLGAGATATRDAVVTTAAHSRLEPLRELLERGRPLDAALAATFGDVETLRTLLRTADRDDVQLAFGLAVINRQATAARVALEAGADIDGFLPVHSHSTALHQAVAHDSPELVTMLLEGGAQRDIRDALWNATPLDWANHAGHRAAAQALTRR